MKLENAIKKLEKLGCEVKRNGPFYRAILNDHAIEFHEQGGDITCINACLLRMEKDRDSMSDYFPETFFSNLTKAIRFCQR